LLELGVSKELPVVDIFEGSFEKGIAIVKKK